MFTCLSEKGKIGIEPSGPYCWPELLCHFDFPLVVTSVFNFKFPLVVTVLFHFEFSLVTYLRTDLLCGFLGLNSRYLKKRRNEYVKRGVCPGLTVQAPISIHVQILLTDLLTFLYSKSWDNLSKYPGNLFLVIILLLLMTYSRLRMQCFQ